MSSGPTFRSPRAAVPPSEVDQVEANRRFGSPLDGRSSTTSTGEDSIDPEAFTQRIEERTTSHWFLRRVHHVSVPRSDTRLTVGVRSDGGGSTDLSPASTSATDTDLRPRTRVGVPPIGEISASATAAARTVDHDSISATNARRTSTSVTAISARTPGRFQEVGSPETGRASRKTATTTIASTESDDHRIGRRARGDGNGASDQSAGSATATATAVVTTSATTATHDDHIDRVNPGRASPSSVGFEFLGAVPNATERELMKGRATRRHTTRARGERRLDFGREGSGRNREKRSQKENGGPQTNRQNKTFGTPHSESMA